MRSLSFGMRVVIFLTPLVIGCGQPTPESSVALDRTPRIWPDYGGLVIPPNIAPLNFAIEEPGARFRVVLQPAKGAAIRVSPNRNGVVKIPLRQWQKLLRENAGGSYQIQVYARGKGGWSQFAPLTNRIAAEPVDPYVVYRKLGVNYNWFREMGIHQRRLSDFSERQILHSRNYQHGCFNCHTFNNGDPQTFFLHVRSRAGSCALYAAQDSLHKIGTKLGYTAWHPSGRFATLSLNTTRQFMHALGMEMRDIMDLNSCIVKYSLDSRAITTIPALSGKQDLETYPAWSPDGTVLYFCAAPILWQDMESVPESEVVSRLRYSLMRIGFDTASGDWGAVDTLLSAEALAKSLTLPRVSPDGRWLVFCTSDYGPSPHMRTNGDLYIMDLSTREYRDLGVNSPYAESWHSWSRNSRWLVFSSKAQGGVYTRAHLCYVDSTGAGHKSFPLPQKDPQTYRTELGTFSVPEFTTGKIGPTQRDLVATIGSRQPIEANLPVTSATAKAPKAYPTDAVRE